MVGASRDRAAKPGHAAAQISLKSRPGALPGEAVCLLLCYRRLEDSRLMFCSEGFEVTDHISHLVLPPDRGRCLLDGAWLRDSEAEREWEKSGPGPEPPYSLH